MYGVDPQNRQGLEEEKFSKGDWCDLLSISHRYECERARERSIKEIDKLNPPLDDVGKITMAKRFGIEEWLLPACMNLVERQTPLTYTEAHALGLTMTVLLSEAREKSIQTQTGRTFDFLNSHDQQSNRHKSTCEGGLAYRVARGDHVFGVLARFYSIELYVIADPPGVPGVKLWRSTYWNGS